MSSSHSSKMDMALRGLLSTKYFQRLSSVAASRGSDLSLYRIIEIQDYIAEVVKTAPPKSFILDVGCGNGEFCLSLGLMGYQTIGGDGFNAHWLDTRTLDAQTSFLAFDGRFLPFKSGVFGHCCLIGVLEHVGGANDEILLLGEIRRVLKMGGILMIYDLPKFMGLEHIYLQAKYTNQPMDLAKKRYSLGKRPVIHNKFYSDVSISSLLTKVGFKVADLSHYHILPRIPRAKCNSIRLLTLYILFDRLISKLLPWLTVFIRVVACRQ